MKKVGLISFLLVSSVGFFAFNASPVPGCRNGCFTNVTYTANNQTLPINKWVEYCSLSPTSPAPGAKACVQAATQAEFESCVANFCPFLPGVISSAGNRECATCLSVPVPGEALVTRIFKCSANYIDTDAVNCAVRPQDLSVLAGNWATFRLPAGMSTAAMVQWQMSTNNGASFSPAPGGTVPVYGLSALLGLNGSQYQPTFTNVFGVLVTRAATLTVSSQTAPTSLLFVSNNGGQGMVELYNGANGAFVSNFTPVDVPKGIAMDPATGSVLVAASVENQILKFNGQTSAPAGVFVDGTLSCGGSSLNGPAGIAFGPDSHLYVADTGNNRVVRYDGLTGSCLGSYATGSTLNRPNGLTFGNDGFLYVANLGGSVARFAPGTGAAAGSVAVGTTPAGIAISPIDDNLYVTDRVSSGQVFVIARNTFPSASPTAFVSSPAGGLNTPEGLVFGPDNNLYVTSAASNQVQRFHGSTGALLSTFINNTPTGVGPTFLAFGAPSTTSAGNATATFSPSNQTLNLSATVTSPGATVNTGTVVFSVYNVNTQIGAATASAAVSNGSASATYTLPGGTAAGVYTIRATYSGGGIFTGSTDMTRTLTVNQATPVITWSNPANILFGSALSGSQLNATANTAGTFIYSPPTGTVLPAGNGQTLSVQFNPANAVSYRTATATVQINVTPGSAASLISTNVLTRDAGTNEVVVRTTIANTGGSPATAVIVNTAVLNGRASTTALPVVVGNIPGGGTAAVTLRFPASVGAAAARVVLSMSGSHTGGTFSQGARVVLP